MSTARPTTSLSDPDYTTPYVDVDEWRDEPVRHRYVHGGFDGTDCRFSCTSRRRERYQGRFFHPVSPVPGTEHASAAGGSRHGGYIDVLGRQRRVPRGVEPRARSTPFPGEDSHHRRLPRQRGGGATYSRVLAAEMYGEHRPYGYVFGGSGGGYRTMACIENTDVWDGAVPYIHGTPMSLPEHVLGAGARHARPAGQAAADRRRASSRAAAATCTPA